MVEKQNKWQQLGNAVSELEFITSLFSWIFNFLSRIAEPLMTLAVIYTIIVSGLPQAMVPALYNAAMAIMIGSPEVILPGADSLPKECWCIAERARPSAVLGPSRHGR